jgi:hypothetical protein
MAKDYTLEIIDRSEDGKPIRPKLRVIHQMQEHWVNTFADMSEGYVLDEMGQWCIDNECGHRTSYNEFKFRTQEQMAHFIMRWS